MRIFILISLLFLNLQYYSKADDISEFQIEGLAIGDSIVIFSPLDQNLGFDLLLKKKIYHWKYF